MDPLDQLIQLLIKLLGITIALSFVAASLWLGAYIGLLYIRHKKREEKSLDSVLLEIAVPRDNEVKIDAAEQMFGALYSIKRSGWKMRFDSQDVISFEIVAKNEDIRFYVWCPKKLRDLIEKQVHGAYADADIKEVDEYNFFTESGKVAYSSLQLRSDNFYPIKNFKDMATDPLSSITSVLAKMQDGEGVAIQVLISPADNDWKSSGRAYLSKTKKSESDPEKASYKVDAKTMEAIDNKLGKPGFETSIRFVACSPDELSAKTHISNLKAAFEQFSGDINGFKGRKIRYKPSFITDFLYRFHPIYQSWGNRKMILNSEELATIFHFPNRQIATPHIHWLNAKRAPAPSQIPTVGTFIGTSSYRGVDRPVYLQEIDRRRHLYIIGKTGTGKSELLKDMIMQDVRAGKGVCFMDPHGDAVEDILKMIPPERAEDVIYFDPSDIDRPIGINLLEAKDEQQMHFVATAILNLMYKLYDPYRTGIIGPRFEHNVRNAMMTAHEIEGATFIEVVRILTKPDFVQELIPHIKDPVIKSYWTDQIAQTAEFHKSEILDYVVSKFGRFVTNKMIRNIIGQSQTTLDFRKIMDEGKILLVNLSKGKLGEEISSFLGLILVPRILMAALSRTDMPEKDRRDFYLYVDEFQNFATPDFAQILSEARKYRLSLCVANQFIGQIEEEIKNAIFGNVGSVMAFRCGVADANYLAREFQPVFDEDDLLNIEAYNLYMKTIVNNEPVPPFSVSVYKDMSQVEAQKSERISEIIREMSRLTYGRDSKIVAAEIQRRSKY